MKKRKSESTIKHPEIEYLQGGILLRYNYKQVTQKDEMTGVEIQMWTYDEFWVKDGEDAKKLPKEFVLTENQKNKIKEEKGEKPKNEKD